MKSQVETGEDRDQAFVAVCLSLGNEGHSHNYGRRFFLLPMLWPQPCLSPPASSWPRVIKALITKDFEMQDVGPRR